MAKKTTPEWLVMTSDGEARWTSRKLRKRILESEVSGEERVRRIEEPDSALRPLHSTELYQQTLGLSPGNAALEASARRVRGFAAHAAAFLGVGALLGFPWWMVFWGIGLVSHLTSAAPSLRRLQASGRALPAFLGDLPDAERAEAEPVAAPVAEPEPIPEPAPAGLPASVASDWAALEQQLPGLPEPARR